MRRAYLIVSVLSIATILILAGLVIVGLLVERAPPEVSDLGWGIDEGEVFQYRMRAWGWTSAGHISDWLEDQILSLDGTTLNATVVSLPSVTGAFNATTFGLHIVRHSKVSCVLANGTDLEEELEYILNSSISRCFLPIGDWSGIDDLYIDELPYWGTAPLWYYASILHEDYLQFSCAWFSTIDSKDVWSGNVTLTDGVPTVALWEYTHQYPGLYVEFSLLQPD